MQLVQFYNIATKVSSRKSDTTFGDLPDWLNYFQNQIGSLILGLIYLSIYLSILGPGQGVDHYSQVRCGG